MLRVTPIYGSEWSSVGAAEEPSCTLIEYGGCRVLLNVGWKERHEFPAVLPEHDCLLLTDSTLESMGALPLYYEQMSTTRMPTRSTTTTTSTSTSTRTTRTATARTTNTASSSTNSSNDNRTVPPIYATFPIVKMGQMTLYDQHGNISLDGGKAPFTLEQIDSAISHIQSIKYSQQILLTPAAAAATANKSNYPTLSVTAHRAGHVVGGAFFVLQRLQDETTVVVTKIYHIAKELHLDSSTLLKHATTPDVLVTYPGGPALRSFQSLAVQQHQHQHQQQQQHNNNNNSNNKQQHKKPPPLAPQLVTQVERKLTERVMAVLRRNGHVLIPTDAASRVLELLFLFNQHWERHRLKAAYNLVWLGPMVQNTVEFAKSQLEWMSQQLLQTNNNNNNNNSANDPSSTGPNTKSNQSASFSIQNLLKTIQFCATVTQVEQLMQQNPTCILATGLSLEHGPARNILLLLADNPDNAILFTDSSQAHLRSTATATSNTTHHTNTTADDTTTSNNNNNNEDTMTNNTPTTTTNNTPDATMTTTSTAAIVDPNDDDDNSGTSDAAPRSSDKTTTTTTTTIATTTVSPWTTAAQLLRAWGQAKAQGLEDEDMEDSIWIDVHVPKRVPLQGTELIQFLAAEKEARRLQRILSEQRAMLREVELAKGQLRLGELGGGGGTTSLTSEQATTSAEPTSTSTTADHKSNKNKHHGTTSSQQQQSRPRKKSRFDQTLFLKFSKPLHLSFEVREEAVGIGQSDSIAKFGIGESIGRQGEILEDDYGISVKHDHFTDIVSGVDPSKFGASGRVGDDVLRRGFGYAGSSGSGIAGSSGSGPKTVSEDEGPHSGKGGGGDGSGGVDDLNEQELEAMDLSEGRGIIRGRHGRPPMKVTTVTRRLEVLAEISYIPLEGRVDARAARQSVRALQPRKVVVLGGPAPTKPPQDHHHHHIMDSVTLLAQAARSFVTTLATTEEEEPLLTPSNGETIELNIGHAAYAVRLLDTPYQTTEEKQQQQQAESNDPPEPVEPYEVKLGACTVSLIDHVFTGQKVALDGSLVLAPRRVPLTTTSDLAATKSTYLSAGDVLLTDLRAELIAQGFKADYTSHREGYSQLIVNGRIVVQKQQQHNNNNKKGGGVVVGGQITVEGPLCEDFWTVRQIVCRQYVVL